MLSACLTLKLSMFKKNKNKSMYLTVLHVSYCMLPTAAKQVSLEGQSSEMKHWTLENKPGTTKEETVDSHYATKYTLTSQLETVKRKLTVVASYSWVTSNDLSVCACVCVCSETRVQLYPPVTACCCLGQEHNRECVRVCVACIWHWRSLRAKNGSKKEDGEKKK